MDWMSNLFVVLFITSITGTIFYVIGMAFSRIWFRDDVRLLRIQIGMVQWAFILPFVYIILYLRSRVRFSTAGNVNNLFYEHAGDAEDMRCTGLYMGSSVLGAAGI